MPAVALAAAVLCGSVASAQIVAMGELHRNNPDGTPAAPYSIGAVVTVSGVVTVGTGVLSRSHLEIYLQDSTGAISVYAPSISWQVRTGDSVTITGQIDQFRGLTEIKNPSSLINHGPARVQPQPLDLTCRQVAESFLPDGREPNESRLIRLRGVTFRSTGQYTGVLLDSTGGCTIYLDPDASVSLPQGRFDVVGILKQYDPEPPYTDGYEIVPRSAADVISQEGPTFVSGPIEVSIGPSAVVVQWETAEPSTGRFEYGQTVSYELGAVEDTGGPQKRHTLTITGLTPATIYHGRAVAVDERGSSFSDDLIFCTASPPEASGTIAVYFNQSVDTSAALARKARGNVNLRTELVRRLGQAQYSIDACFFTLTDDYVSDALITAHRRGVRVRVIVEQDNWSPELTSLVNEGIPVIDDGFGANDGSGKMHNKFVVIDARDRSSAADDWVWTGSYNPTLAGATENAENAIAIQDQALALAYTLEFDEMWGSSGDEPNPDSSRFGARKRDNTPHRFTVGGVWVEAYFSPTDGVTSRIVQAIESADRNALFCIYSFTRNDVSNAFRARWESMPGFKLAGVFENENVTQPGSEWPAMSGTGPDAWPRPADVHLDLPGRLLHHKYLIVDALRPGYEPVPDPLVVTGSHNWTTSAETVNDENILIVHDEEVANLYVQEFVERYRESGGQDPIITGVAGRRAALVTPGDFEFRLAVAPNPSRGRVRIRLEGMGGRRDYRLRLYDVRGRQVSTWLARDTELPWEVTWDGRDAVGRPVASGLYLAVAEGGGRRLIRRLVILQ